MARNEQLIRQHKLLQILEVSETQLSAAGLKVLEQLPAVKELALYNCSRVDDTVVPLLMQLPQLQWVDLKGTKVTASGVAQLRERRPRLRIVVEPAS